MMKRVSVACMLIGGTYKPGDPAPEGYLAWHEWAGVQYKAGLRQVPCGTCNRWCFPQELSDQTVSLQARQSRDWPVLHTITERICLRCAGKAQP